MKLAMAALSGDFNKISSEDEKHEKELYILAAANGHEMALAKVERLLKPTDIEWSELSKRIVDTMCVLENLSAAYFQKLKFQRFHFYGFAQIAIDRGNVEGLRKVMEKGQLKLDIPAQVAINFNTRVDNVIRKNYQAMLIFC